MGKYCCEAAVYSKHARPYDMKQRTPAVVNETQMLNETYKHLHTVFSFIC